MGLDSGSENHLFTALHKVRRATHPQGPTVEDMGIDQRGAPILLAQELLDRADVLSSLQQPVASVTRPELTNYHQPPNLNPR